MTTYKVRLILQTTAYCDVEVKALTPGEAEDKARDLAEAGCKWEMSEGNYIDPDDIHAECMDPDEDTETGYDKRDPKHPDWKKNYGEDI